MALRQWHNARRLRIDRDASRSNLGAILPLHDFRYRIARVRTKSHDFGDGRARRSLQTSQTPAGGARRDRTDDLLLAKQALSQLSYGPAGGQNMDDRGWKGIRRRSSVVCRVIMVGLGRFELPTSRLSSARSNQLSYKPLPDDGGQTTDDGTISPLSSVLRPLIGLVCEEREMETAASRLSGIRSRKSVMRSLPTAALRCSKAGIERSRLTDF